MEFRGISQQNAVMQRRCKKKVLPKKNRQRLCLARTLVHTLAERDPRCDALWQTPKNHNASSFHEADEVWFCNVPMGKHKLENLLTEMCKTAGLRHIYTPHCI